MTVAATTTDVFLGGKLEIEQPAKGFRAGLDAVLLAAAVEAEAGRKARVLDAGAGVGTAGLCLAARLPAVRVTMVEIAPQLCALARQNVERNGLGARVDVIEADLTAAAREVEAHGLAPDTFEHVMANPPYLEDGRHRLPADPVAAGAFGMAAEGLERWARFLARMAVPGGSLTMIHRADALATVLDALDGRFGELRILPLHPRVGEPAHRILVTGRKASRAPLRLLPGLVLHGEGHAFTPEVAAILRDGAALRWP